MPAAIELVGALPGRPVTSRLLELYRTELRRQQGDATAGEALWLAPTHRSQNAVRYALLNDSLPVCFRPNVFTFDEFADKVLRDSSQTIAPLSAWLQRTLLRRIVGRLAESGRLKHFARIAHTAGFLDEVSNLIAELKRGETWPEQYEQAVRSTGASPRDRELSLIYTEYQNELVARNWYDTEGRFWSARTALRNGEWGSFENLSLVVADGFSDFTPTQYEILALLAARVDRVLVTMPWEEPLVRGDLFAKPRAVRERLEFLSEGSGPLAPHPQPLSPGGGEGGTSPALRWIAHKLFANPREMQPATETAGVEIVTAAGQLGEVHAVAARVKQLLLDGVAPVDVVVCVRDLGEYADLIDEVFTAAGLPFACDSGTLWSRLPEAKAVVSLWQLEAEDWPFRRLLDWIDSPYFFPGPEWPLPPGGLAEVRHAVSSELRRWKLHAGRQQILACLDRVSQSATADESSSSATRIAHAFLTKLSDVLTPLRREHDFGGWVETFAAVLRDCGCPLTAPDAGASVLSTEYSVPSTQHSALSTQHSILSSLIDALFATVRIEQQLESPRMLSLEDFLADLADLLEHHSQSRADNDAGRVRVLNATEVRHLDVPHLFVAGLTEGSFPRLWRDDCLYTESERRRLNEHGLTLGHQTSRMQDEMLLFFSVVTRATKHLVLSYPAISSSGQPLSPSPYLQAVQELFDPSTLPIHRDEQLDPVPRRDRLLTAADARVRAVQDALDGDAVLFRSLMEVSCQSPVVTCQSREAGVQRTTDNRQRTTNDPPSTIHHPPSTETTCRTILAAADMSQRRFASRGFTDFEGLLALPRNRDRLARRFGAEAEFSATQLELYAACPFRFFAQHVLGLKELESPETETNVQQRGIVVHEVLAKLHREMIALESRLQAAPAEAGTPTDIGRKFRELLHEALWRRPAATELQAALREIEERVLAEWGASYAEQWQAYQLAAQEKWSVPPMPTHLEIGFGHPGGSSAETEHETITPSLVIGDGVDAIRIGGRIDRIDVGEVAGQRSFSVIDYKTGKAKAATLTDITAGHNLQLALYALAVERLGLAGANARPFELGYWLVKQDGFVFGLRGDGRTKADKYDRLTDELWQSVQDVLHDVVPRLAQGIRAGAFPVFNEDQSCTANCPFNTVCRVNQIRPLEEALGKGWEC
jgi:ATP-dependent helicase/DNAse subunit B